MQDKIQSQGLGEQHPEVSPVKWLDMAVNSKPPGFPALRGLPLSAESRSGISWVGCQHRSSPDWNKPGG